MTKELGGNPSGGRFATPAAEELSAPTGTGPDAVPAGAGAAVEAQSQQTDDLAACLQGVLAHIDNAVIATDTVGNIRFLNPVAASLTGWSLADATGRPLEDVFQPVHQDTQEPVEQPLRQSLASEERVVIAARTALPAHNGSVRPIEASAAPIHRPDGRLIGAVLVFYDLTDRIRAEQSLRMSEERLRAIFEQAAVGIAVANLQGRFIETNHKFGEILGYGEDELRTLGYADITHPDDIAETEKNVRKLLSGETHYYSMEKRYRRRDGKIVWSSTTVTSLRGPSGQIEQLLGVIADITPRVLAQETLRQEARVLELLHATGGAITSRLDLRTVLQTATDAATQLSGAQFGAFFYNVIDAHGEALLLYTLSGAPREAFEKFGIPRNTPVFEPTFRGEGILRSDDITADPRYGKLGPHYGMPKGHLPVRSYLSVPVISPSGEVIGGIFLGHAEPGVFGERTERLIVGVAGQAAIAVDNARLYEHAQAEIERRTRAENALLDTDRRKDEFLATLAHELRNPLAPIHQAVMISRADSATPQQREWSHDVINRQVRHMSLLLDDLLDISRITRGALPLRIEMTDLSEVVDAAVETSQPVIDDKQHRLHIDLPESPVRFAADPLRLGQVLSNLLTNAAKYTPPGGDIRLTGSTSGDSLRISVSDTGIGIPPDSLPQLFAMFSQVRSSLSQVEGGLGIGLALSKGLVELHGGTIEARSGGTGEGSEFVLQLPLRMVEESVEPPVPNAGAADLAGRRVLVADDNRDAADSLALLLRMEGHDVTVVHDGQAALSAYMQLKPEIALLDIGMAQMDGYELARRIRASTSGREAVLVAVTGWGQESDKATAFAAGFDHHFTKPVSLERLERLLRQK